jgi:hypothetical protein
LKQEHAILTILYLAGAKNIDNVHNQSRTEGCMVQGWAMEEVIEFAIDYMDLEVIGKPI